MQAQTIDKMANDIVSVNEVQGEVIFYQPDNTMRIEVRLENETVWLTQQQMAELFSTDRTSIARHIGNIYTADELEEGATCAKIAQVRQEGMLPKALLHGRIAVRAFSPAMMKR